MDLVSVYRDAIAVSAGAPGQLVNEEIRPDVEKVVRASTPELNLRRIGWIFDAREQMLEFNVPVPLALESMMLALKVPDGADGETPGRPRRCCSAWWWPAAGRGRRLAPRRRRRRRPATSGPGPGATPRARAGSTKPPSRALKRFYAPGHRVVPLRGLRDAGVRHRDRAARLRRPTRSTIDLALVKEPAAEPDAAAGHARW